jgi:hypothetical protein
MKRHGAIGLVFSMACSGAAVAGPETATEVLEKTRRATGHANIASLETGIEGKGKTSIAGLECEYSLLFAGDRACVQRIDGPMSITAAIDGDTVWITDMGGETRRVVNADRERWEMGLMILNHGWLGEKTPLRFEVDEGASTESEAVLRFRMQEGRTKGTLTIDRGKWLPREWTYATGGPSTTVALSDYVDFGGVKIAKTVETQGPNVMNMRLESVGAAPVFFRSPYQMMEAGFADTVFDAGVAPELEIVRAPTGHVLVHPRVNGKDVGWFIFDTGAGSMILSTPVAAEMGIEQFGEVPAHGVGGKTTGAFCRPETVTLGPVTMSKPLMVTLDLSFLDQHMGRRVAGLVGYNLLARVVAKIDMEAPSVSLYEPAGFKGEGMKWEKLVIDQRIPLVRARFENHEGLFKLDTGAAQKSVSMHAPAVKELKLLEGREATDSQAGGVGGMVKVKKGELAWFELGGKRTERVKAEFAVVETGAFNDPYTLGNIGGVLLKPFVIVTDYRGGRIAFVER